MNRSLVQCLIKKDWYLNRSTLAFVAAGSVVAFGLILRGGEVPGFFGLSFAFIVLILLGIMLPQLSVVAERTKQNLPFVMSLPISVMDYTTAKILANLAMFLMLWLAIVIGVLVVFSAAGLYGVIPVAIVVAFAPFVQFILVLGTALVSESETITNWVMGVGNVSYSLLWFLLIRIPSVRTDMTGPAAVWSPLILSILAVEVAAIVATLGLTFYLQSRKTDFV
jgi:ABC-2 type transport system permease protein